MISQDAKMAYAHPKVAYDDVSGPGITADAAYLSSLIADAMLGIILTDEPSEVLAITCALNATLSGVLRGPMRDIHAEVTFLTHEEWARDASGQSSEGDV